DAKTDLIMVDAGGYISVVLGNGDGSFGSRVDFPLWWSMSGLAVADVNGDGATDVMTANPQFLSISLLLCKGDGTLGMHVGFYEGDYLDWFAMGDMNGDGTPDIVTATHYNYTWEKNLGIFLGNGDGTFPTFNFRA